MVLCDHRQAVFWFLLRLHARHSDGDPSLSFLPLMFESNSFIRLYTGAGHMEEAQDT